METFDKLLLYFIHPSNSITYIRWDIRKINIIDSLELSVNFFLSINNNF